MFSTHRNVTKGIAAASLAMLMALPALTGCSMDKPDPGDAQETTSQTQTASSKNEAAPKAATKTPAKGSSASKKSTKASTKKDTKAKASTKKAATKTPAKASSKTAGTAKNAPAAKK